VNWRPEPSDPPRLGDGRFAGADTERPPSSLQPALLLIGYLGWAAGACLYLVGIPATSIASGRLVPSSSESMLGRKVWGETPSKDSHGAVTELF